MRSHVYVAGVFLSLCALPAQPSERCSGLALWAAADVSVSDGSGFRIESIFGGVDQAAIRFIDSNVQVLAVEGPFAWVSENGAASPGQDLHKVFTLGHQFHALFLDFEQLAEGIQPSAGIRFGDTLREALSGDYPYGGRMHLVSGDGPREPAGFVFEFPETPWLEVHFSDWRTVDDVRVPFYLEIHDGSRVFEYRYTDIRIARKSKTWFHDQVPAPDIEAVLEHRAAEPAGAGCLGTPQ